MANAEQKEEKESWVAREEEPIPKFGEKGWNEYVDMNRREEDMSIRLEQLMRESWKTGCSYQNTTDADYSSYDNVRGWVGGRGGSSGGGASTSREKPAPAPKNIMEGGAASGVVSEGVNIKTELLAIYAGVDWGASIINKYKPMNHYISHIDPPSINLGPIWTGHCYSKPRAAAARYRGYFSMDIDKNGSNASATNALYMMTLPPTIKELFQRSSIKDATGIRMEGETSGVVSDAAMNLKTEPIAIYAGRYVGASFTTEQESEQRINIVEAQKARIQDAKRARQEVRLCDPNTEIRSLAGRIFVKVSESERQAADAETHYKMMLSKYKSGAAVDRALENVIHSRAEAVTLYEHWSSIVKDYSTY